MAKIGAHQLTMSRGEVTPLVHARIDTQDYRLGLKTCQNWLPLKYGGLTRVPGTTDLNACANAATISKLITFTFNQDQSYAVEFSNLKIRFQKTSGYIATSEIVSTYTTADVVNIRATSIGDIIYITCDGHPVRTITRSSDTSWALADYAPQYGPFLPRVLANTLKFNDTGHATLVMASNSGADGSTITASSGTIGWRAFDQDKDTYAQVDDEDGWIKINFGDGNNKQIVNYHLRANAVHSTDKTMPVDWAIEASADDAEWVTLDAHRETSDWLPGEHRHFEFVNATAYRYWRVSWTALGGIGTKCAIGEWGMSEALNDSGSATFTLGGVADVNGGAGFKSTDIGRQIRILDSDNIWRVWQIQTRSSSTVVTAKLLGPSPFFTASSTSVFQMGAWSVDDKYPRSILRHKGRLWFFRSDTQPTTAWASVVSSYADHGVSDPLVDDDAINVTFEDGDLDEILWARSNGDDILAGTAGGVRILSKRDQGLVLSPSNLEESGRAPIRAGITDPVWIDKILVYADKQRVRLIETAFSLDDGGYVARELTMLAEHLFSASKIKEIHFQHIPNNTLWVILTDGSLRACTYDRQQQVFGVTTVVYPGTTVTIESMAILPDTDYDVPMIVVGRTVNASLTYRIEKILDPYRSGGRSSLAFPHYLAAAVVYSGSSVTVITGLGHLEGEVVGVYDTAGTDLGDATVASSQITVPGGNSVTGAVVGLRMTSTFTNLKPPNISENGEYIANPQRVVEASVDVFETYGLKAGGSAHTTDLTTEADHKSSPTVKVLHTGELTVHPEEGWGEAARITISTDRAYSATVRALQVVMEKGL